MKLLSLPQPWASAVAMGHCAVVNLPRRPPATGLSRGDLVLIHAGGRVDTKVSTDQKAMAALAGTLGYGLALAKHHQVLLGVARVTSVCPADECQLLFGVGPWCVCLDADRRVFYPPLEFAAPEGASDIETGAIEIETGRLVSVGAALALMTQEAMALETAERGGWTGD